MPPSPRRAAARLSAVQCAAAISGVLHAAGIGWGGLSSIVPGRSLQRFTINTALLLPAGEVVATRSARATNSLHFFGLRQM